MKITPRTESEAVLASRRTLLKPGWHDGLIREAVDKTSQRGNEMMELITIIRGPDGEERLLRDYLTDSKLSAAKLRHACAAIGALARYDSGELEASDFPGHVVRVRVGVEKKKGFPDRNVIEDYAAPEGRVVSLRSS